MYTVYKITNIINNKFYIGVHKTQQIDDSYFGSGRAIKDAIIKYGKENFIKTIIFITENKQDAYNLEYNLTHNFSENNNYNLKQGGIGGFNKEDSWCGFIARSKKGGLKSKDLGYSFGGIHSSAIVNGKKGGLMNKNKPKSEKHKQALRDSWIKKREHSQAV